MEGHTVDDDTLDAAQLYLARDLVVLAAAVAFELPEVDVGTLLEFSLITGLGVSREDHMQVGAVGDLDLLEAEEARAVSELIDDRPAAATVETVGVLELAACDLYWVVLSRHVVAGSEFDLGHTGHNRFDLGLGHVLGDGSCGREGKTLLDGAVQEEGRDEPPGDPNEGDEDDETDNEVNRPYADQGCLLRLMGPLYRAYLRAVTWSLGGSCRLGRLVTHGTVMPGLQRGPVQPFTSRRALGRSNASPAIGGST